MADIPLKILITNQKGGVGKSTLSANLTGYLAIEKQLAVSLIDFDKQGTSSNFTNKRAHENIQTYKCGLSYQQTASVTFLEARAALRRCSTDAQVTLADLTWTFGLPYEFMLDFDILIVPSSNSKVEIASTEIFILEYVQKQMAKIKQKQQMILIAPSRVDRNQIGEAQFAGLQFLDNCFVCPPIYRISQINHAVLEDFWFRVENLIVAENMMEFCDFVFSKMSIKQAELAALNQPPVQNSPPNRLEQLRLEYRASQPSQSNLPIAASQLNRANNILDSLSPTSEQQRPEPISNKGQRELSFIPHFLRKK